MKRLLARIRSFLRTCLIGGLLVLVPIGLLVAVVAWLYGLITDLIQPLTDVVTKRWAVGEYVADALVLVGIVMLCFGVGLGMKTWVGRVLFDLIEQRLRRVAPGYSLIKQTAEQLLGRRGSPFIGVAMCSLDGSKVLVTAFITERHADGRYSVFVPDSPNPLSGCIFHLPAEQVYVVAVPIEQAMQTIISCGAGSQWLLNKCEAGIDDSGGDEGR